MAQILSENEVIIVIINISNYGVNHQTPRILYDGPHVVIGIIHIYTSKRRAAHIPVPIHK